MSVVPKRNAPLAVIALIVAIVGVILVVMWVAGLGFFAPAKHDAAGTTTPATATLTTTAPVTTATTPAVKIPAFNPASETQSRAYFESLWTSTKAAAAEVKNQERVVKSNPTVDNETTLVGLKQNCTVAVASYNAAALAIASKAFRSAGLPPQISPKECSA